MEARAVDLARPDAARPDGKVAAAGDQLALDSKILPDTKKPDAFKPDAAGPDKGSTVCVGHCDQTNCATLSPCVDPSRTLVIHEVYCLKAKPDYVVLRNASTVPQDIEKHVLETWGTVQASFTLPKRVLQPGETVAVVELSSGGQNDISTGANIPFYAGFLSNAVVLRSPSNAVVDYVGFGASLKGLPIGISQSGGPVSYGSPFNADGLDTDAHFRAGLKGKTPTVQAADWIVAKMSR